MQHLSWVMASVFCVSAAAQQPQPQFRPPVSVGIVFDTSRSMGSKLQRSRQLVAQFMKTANSQDEFFLVQSNDRPVLASAFTADTAEIQNGLAFIEPKGRSALLDAIYLALHEMKKARNSRKALLVISDGADSNSLYTDREINNLVSDTAVRIYPIGVYEPLPFRGRTAEELYGPARLNEIAKQSRGRHFAVESLEEMPDVIAKVDTEMRAPLTP